MFHLLYGLCDGSVNLYALTEYQYTGFTGSILQFYVLMKALKCLGILVLTEINIFLCRVIKNVYLTYIVLLSVLVAGLYCSGFAGSTNPVIQYALLWNPLSVFQFVEISKKYYGLNFFNHYIPWLSGIIIVQLVFLLAFKFCERRKISL
jgi:hypothetical protein